MGRSNPPTGRLTTRREGTRATIVGRPPDPGHAQRPLPRRERRTGNHLDALRTGVHAAMSPFTPAVADVRLTNIAISSMTTWCGTVLSPSARVCGRLALTVRRC